MATKTRSVKRCICERCGHEWTPRNRVVYICPRCKSAKWNVVKGHA